MSVKQVYRTVVESVRSYITTICTTNFIWDLQYNFWL